MTESVRSWKPGASVGGVKDVALSEDFFDDYFPLKPIMPGALIVEGMRPDGPLPDCKGKCHRHPLDAIRSA
ncbi:MAG: hypothetical protein PHH62_06555 [Endomicrobiaceae bacterium]|nr:hypothetical protein [Endomicrobiaceae bacterium]